ncbi:hypothetical protein BC829DRAFT_487067 [Chytridium lagenaria]|nr:hypothetical protein BC829DRAFT_487067 [Chytridium lagenaria]
MGSDSLNLGDTTPSSENLRRASSTSTDSSQTSNPPPITNVKSEDMRRSDELRESTSHDHMNASKPPLPRSRSLARDSRSPSQTPHMSNESMDRSQVSVDRDSKSPRRSRSASLGARKPSFLSREALSSDFRRQRSLPIDDDVDRGRTRSSTALKGRSKVKLYVDTMKSGRSSPVSRRGDLPPPPKTPPPLPPTGSPRQRPRSAMGRTPSPTRSLKRAGSPQRSLKSRGLGDEQAGNQPPKIKIKVKSPTAVNKVITLKGDDILPTPLRRRTSSQTPSHISHPDSDLFSHDDDLPSDNEGTGTQDEDDRKKSLIANSAPLRGIVASPNQSMGSFNMLTRSMGSGLVGVSTSSGTLVYLDEGRKEESMGTDAIAKAAEVNLAILEAGEPDLLFVDDGGKFRQKRRIVDDNKDLELNIDSKFDQKLQALCDSVNINAYHTLNALYGLHAGLCLTTLTLFPILQYTPFTSRDNLALLAFYRASIAAIDWAAGFGEGREVGLGVGETTMTMETRKTRRWWKVRRPWVEATMKWWKKRSGRFKRIAALISVLLALASFLSTVMMTYIDDRMFESQAGLYGGLYGQGDWFYNLTALSNTTNSTIQYDLTRWQTLNAWRGSTGVIGWGLYCLARRLNARRRRVKIIQTLHPLLQPPGNHRQRLRCDPLPLSMWSRRQCGRNGGKWNGPKR